MMLKGDVLASADTPIGELALAPALLVVYGTSLGQVARAMERAHVSAVLVGEPPYRIVTERDLTRALASGKTADASALGLASDDVIVAGPNMAVGRAAATMVRYGIRHLPVVTADGDVIGILGLDAVFRILLRESDLSDWLAEFDGVLADGG